MKKNNPTHKKKAPQLSKLLDIPLDMVADVPRMTLNDNRELTVENYKSIESYEPEEIRLRNKSYLITIRGKDLRIIAITDEEILISGLIGSLSFF